jgi:uncharacterized peroxidase-related enzyme
MAGAAQDDFVGRLLSVEDPDLSALSSRERALVRYADVVTLRPASVTRADVDALRVEGLDDLAIHDACSIVAYFAFVNRIADGLGVELEGPAEDGGPAG